MTISTLLVANRGEIARRVIRTAKEMGIHCVAVYVDADRDAPFVDDADEAVRLDTGYLDAQCVLAAARASGADALHPGYGYLSENAAFAEAVEAAGLTWVGPPPPAIAQMGDKLAAKRVAAAAGVPVLASTEDLRDAGTVGYPLLVKAVGGGGGRGMRVVTSPEGLDEAVAAARREALSGFGDDRVFLERYVASSRHVEVQLLGDHHGTLVHLGERECSIQRRHQKLVEESPSPAVDAVMRAAMGAAAIALGRAIHYASAGTVEFLVDDATREFFFLEANTRLQVEHPVTEEVTGIDLVREQLRIAAGEPLGFTQDDVAFRGHAIEVRLCAEDPAAGFLPATGTLAAFDPPARPAVRWESGVERGSVVGTQFDPMLAKVIAHAPTRAEAARRLAAALEGLHIGGVTTNRDLLAATLRDDAFAAGDTTTDFLERCAPARSLALTDDERRRAAIVAAMWIQAEHRDKATVWAHVPSGWRNARLPDQRVTLRCGGDELTITYRARRDGAFVTDAGEVVTLHARTPTSLDCEIDSRRMTAQVTRGADRLYVQVARGTLELVEVARFEVPGGALATGSLVAPMPGVIVDVRVAAGAAVDKGAVVVVMEAMKMEHHLVSPTDGIVTEVLVDVGDRVDTGAALLVLDDGAGAP